MVEKATGIILRTRRLTETSLIVHWLTASAGRLATVAKGALRPKSPFRGKLDVFFLADFSFSRSRRSELHNLREVAVVQTHPALRQDVACLQQAAYCTALIETATETETPLPEIFELFRGFLEAVSHPEPAFVLSFELKLLDELGMQPDLEKARLSPGVLKLISFLAESDWAAVRNVHLSRCQQQELSRFLAGFIAFHIGRVPAGREQATAGAV